MNNRRLLPPMAAAIALSAVAAPSRAVLIEVTTPLGSFTMQTREDVAPNTVNNFLNYINDGDFEDSFIHRSIPGFIVQGGGFTWNTADGLNPVPTDAPINSEFGLSNTRGTVAMAQAGDDPNSATSGWFINTVDNDGTGGNGGHPLNNLDTLNGGFTVFAEVVSGMDVVDAIAALQILDASGGNPNNPFSDVPVNTNYQGPNIDPDEVITTSFAILPEPTSAALLALGGLALARRRRQ